MLKFIGAVTCVGLVALVLIVLFVAGSHGSPSASSGDAASTSLGPAMRVSAMKLSVDYHANEVQADNLYRGRHLLVAGLVSSINKDAFGEIYLALASDNEFMNVDAHLKASEAETAAGLHIMQLVHVDCVGGEMVIGSPQLTDCTIVQDKEPVSSPAASNEPGASSQPVSPETGSEPSRSEPATVGVAGAAKDSAAADALSGDVREGQPAPPQQSPAQVEQVPQQPPAPVERRTPEVLNR